jgi:hypothetical protein
MKILDDLQLDGHLRINTPYDLYTDSIMGTGYIHLSSQVFNGPYLVLENALNLSNDEITRQWEGAGLISFRRRFGDSVPLDKDRSGSLIFEGYTGARKAGVLKPYLDPRTGETLWEDWQAGSAIWGEIVGTPVLGKPKMPGELVFGTAPDIEKQGVSERMRIDKDGNIGIGISKPEARLHINGGLQFQNNNIIYGKTTAGIQESCLIPRSGNNSTFLNYGSSGLFIRNPSAQQALRINNDLNATFNGSVGIGRSADSSYSLFTQGAIRSQNYTFSTSWVETPIIYLGGFFGTTNPTIANFGGSIDYTTYLVDAEHRFYTRGGTERMVIQGNGRVGINTTNPNATLEVNGTIAKRSSTFLIDHPLDPYNKDLFHGMVEAPRYDLIYRGVVRLDAGQAVVDIDKASNMTKGTFTALTQNAEVVALVNKTSYSRLKPSDIVNGEFTISCEDVNSSDTISWVVIAERHDPFIINNKTTRTDENGHLIPEWDKPTL